MAGSYDVLPFPRGETLYGGDTTILSSSVDASLAGRTYRVKDTEHGTGHDVVLRVVQNRGSALTAAKKAVGFYPAAGCFLSKIDGVVGAAGEVAKPLDPVLADKGASVAQYDLCYVVDEGPSTILSSATASSNLPIHTPLVAAAGGALSSAAATTGNHVLGYNDVAITPANTNSAVLIYVCGGYGYEY